MRVHRGNIQGEYKPADPREQADQQVGKHRSKKDTKRWCLGHSGREHDIQWVVDERRQWFRTPYPVDWIQVCMRCQKHFGMMSRDGSIFFHPVTKQARHWAYKGHGWVELFFYGPGLPPAAFRDEDL